ncbi:unnamed protein product [Meloidogyne enterolobii]|uniref:Uncharacterized protein n=1 Tax=Meloidogyne enterolobii TaxID=390850 RepID=A0ACB0ZC71_MELEN
MLPRAFLSLFLVHFCTAKKETTQNRNGSGNNIVKAFLQEKINILNKADAGLSNKNERVYFLCFFKSKVEDLQKYIFKKRPKDCS